MTIEHSGPFLESGLFAGARANVMFALCNYADDYGECWPSHEAVGIAARCSRETSGREIAFLSRHGVVEILKGDERPPEKRRLAGRSNVYRVNLALVRAMYFLVTEAKRLAGRDPARRYGAVRAVADWAEAIIEDHGPAGAAEFVRQAADRLAKGEVMALLGDLPPPVSRDVPSHEIPLSRDDGAASCDGTSHYPSIEPPVEPSRARGEGPVENPSPRRAGDRTATAATGAADRGLDRERGGLASPGIDDGAGGAGDDAGEGPADGAACGALAEPLQPDHPDFAVAALPDDPAAAAALRRKIVFRQRELVLAWLLGAGSLDRYAFLPVLRRSLHSAAEVEAAALAVPGRARRIAQSWVRWARAIARGDPQTNDPHPDVSRLAALLAGPHAAFFAARCARLMGEDGAGEDGNREPGTGGSAAAAPSSCRDPPAGGA